jgi:hypothetical protein
MTKAAEEAIAARDVEALHRAVHSLKGMIGNYSAPRANEAVRIATHHAQHGRLKEAAPAFRQAKAEIDRLWKELEKFRATL